MSHARLADFAPLSAPLLLLLFRCRYLEFLAAALGAMDEACMSETRLAEVFKVCGND
jgi:hypothetical protein